MDTCISLYSVIKEVNSYFPQLDGEINDLDLIGLFCFFIASVTFVRFFPATLVPEGDAEPMWGSSPILTKDRKAAKCETRIGFNWLCLGTSLQIVGCFMPKVLPLWFNPLLELACLVFLTVVILWVTPLVVYRVVERDF